MVRTVFMSIAAQEDNLGDIEIRKILLDWCRTWNSNLIVYTGQMPGEYIDMFPRDGKIRYISSSIEFEKELLIHLLKRPILMFAPGPQILKLSVSKGAKWLLNLINVTLVKLFRGNVIGIGRSFRSEHTFASTLERVLVKKFDLFTVRDNISSSALGLELPFYPDLAFQNNYSPAATTRTLVALSFRYDKEVDVAAFRRAISRLQQSGFEPVLVSQVRRDDALHMALGEKGSVEAILWGSRSHAEQYARVTSIYEKSEFVLSNRLHALLLGFNRGANPVIFSDGTDKLRTTLEPWIRVPVYDQHADFTWEQSFDIFRNSGFQKNERDNVNDRLTNLKKLISQIAK